MLPKGAPRWRTVYEIAEKRGGMKPVLRRMRWHYWPAHYVGADEGKYFQEFDIVDQPFANDIADLIQAACGYFYLDDDKYEPFEGATGHMVTDDEVRRRIGNMQGGNLKREAQRTNQAQYPLDELPFETQRALCEKLDELRADWSYKILGPGC